MSSKRTVYDYQHFQRRMLLVIACVFYILAFIQLKGAVISTDYIEVPGYVTDISSRKVLRKRGIKTEYTYTVHWTYEGEEHSQKARSLERPDENLSYVRINKENTDMIAGSLEGQHRGALGSFVFATVALIAGIILYKKDKDKKISKDEWDTILSYTWVMIFIFPFGIFFSYLYLTHTSGATAVLAPQGLMIMFTLAEIIAIVVNRIAKKHTD